MFWYKYIDILVCFIGYIGEFSSWCGLGVFFGFYWVIIIFGYRIRFCMGGIFKLDLFFWVEFYFFLLAWVICFGILVFRGWMWKCVVNNFNS